MEILPDLNQNENDDHPFQLSVSGITELIVQQLHQFTAIVQLLIHNLQSIEQLNIKEYCFSVYKTPMGHIAHQGYSSNQ